MEDRSRVLVIGLDGATWNIIKPLVEEGKLPTIAKLMNNGCYGNLESCIPPITFPAWKCYSTGKNPGKLGAYFYYGVDRAGERFIFHDSTSFRSKELWDYLGEDNITCGVLDMPTTDPCKRINGFMISHGSPGSSGYAYPSALEGELADRFDYKVDSEYSFDFGKDTAISSMKSTIKQRFDVADYLLKKFAPPFFHLTIFNIDQIQHNCWRDMEEDDPKYGKVIEDSWILIDDGIKGLLDESCDEETYVILMSDHGFTGRKGAFQMSRWLAERDLLQLNKSVLLLSGLLFRLGLNRTNFLRTVGRSRTVLTFLRSLMPNEARKKIVGLFPAEVHDLEPNPLGGIVDWKNSKVIPIADSLYINRNALNSEQEYEELRESLIADLKEIEHPRTGAKLAREVYKREDIYFGNYVNRAPDLTILLTEGYKIISRSRSRVRDQKEWVPETDRWTGIHKLEGVFLACGPGIKKGVEIQGARIYDLAPTILHILGTPIPKDMDGKVLKEIFEEDSVLAGRNIRYQEVDEKARIGEKIGELKALGRIP